MQACIATPDATVEAQPLRHYVIVRRDLPWGLQAANIVHAAGESSPGDLPRGTYAVCLHAQDDANLRAIAQQLRAADIPYRAICEPDPPWCGQIMAVGIAPTRDMHGGRLRSIIGALPLVKEATTS